jgi:hypothetical protein
MVEVERCVVDAEQFRRAVSRQVCALVPKAGQHRDLAATRHDGQSKPKRPVLCPSCESVQRPQGLYARAARARNLSVRPACNLFSPGARRRVASLASCAQRRFMHQSVQAQQRTRMMMHERERALCLPVAQAPRIYFPVPVCRARGLRGPCTDGLSCTENAPCVLRPALEYAGRGDAGALRVRVKRLGARGHTCVFAETHADTHTALCAHSLLHARATHRHAPVLLSRPQGKGEGPPPPQERRDVALNTEEPPLSIRGRVFSERVIRGGVLGASSPPGVAFCYKTPHMPPRAAHAGACAAAPRAATRPLPSSRPGCEGRAVAARPSRTTRRPQAAPRRGSVHAAGGENTPSDAPQSPPGDDSNRERVRARVSAIEAEISAQRSAIQAQRDLIRSQRLSLEQQQLGAASGTPRAGNGAWAAV